jgi:hypothetical protein
MTEGEDEPTAHGRQQMVKRNLYGNTYMSTIVKPISTCAFSVFSRGEGSSETLILALASCSSLCRVHQTRYIGQSKRKLNHD